MSASALDLKSVAPLIQGREIKQMPDDIDVKKLGGQQVIVKRNSIYAKLDQNKLWQLNPVSFNAGSFTNNPIVFRIQPKLFKHIDMAFLQLVCSETGGSNTVTPVVAPFLLDRIEIGVNGQPNPVQIIYAEHLYAKWQFLYSEQQNQLFAGNSLNMTTSAYAGESAIAAGGSATYLIPVTISLLDKFNPDVIKNDIIINVYPRANPVSAGTGTLQLTSIQWQFQSNENTIQDAALGNLYSKLPALIDYTNIIQLTYTGTFTAASQVEIPLQGVSGLSPAMFFVIRASKAAASSAIRTFTALGGTVESSGFIDVVNGAKNTLLGSGAISPQLVRYQLPALFTHGDMSSKVPIYWLYFNDNAAASIIHGKINGGVQLTGREFLRLTPGTGFSTGTYTVDMYFYVNASLSLSGGNFKRLM